MSIMRKLQSQGVHHITLVGADRQTSIDFWEGVLGMPFVFEQPNLDNAAESHLYFDPGDGRLITSSRRGAHGRPEPHADRPRLRHHLAFALSEATFAQAVERLDERGIRTAACKDRGFMDSIYFSDPLGLLIELASYRFEPPAGHTHADVLLEAHRSASSAATTTSPRSTWPTPSRRSSPARGVAVGRPLARRTPTDTFGQQHRERTMAAMKMNVLEPSVNNLAVRVFVRAAGLDCEEIDVWGNTGRPSSWRRTPRA